MNHLVKDWDVMGAVMWSKDKLLNAVDLNAYTFRHLDL